MRGEHRTPSGISLTRWHSPDAGFCHYPGSDSPIDRYDQDNSGADASSGAELEGVADVVHWGLLFSSVLLGITLLVGVSGVWGTKGTVMWVARVLFFVFLFGAVWSILARRRDAAPPTRR